MNLFTNVPSPQIKKVFARFLSEQDSDLFLGTENLLLVFDANADYATILSRLSYEHDAFVFSPPGLLETFGSWWKEYKARTAPGSFWSDKEFYVSIIEMGQKQAGMGSAELKRLLDCLTPACIKNSCIHLGFNFAHKDFFALKSELFPRRNGLTPFHPLKYRKRVKPVSCAFSHTDTERKIVCDRCSIKRATRCEQN